MVQENPHVKVTGEIYPEIAFIHKTTAGRVERAIRSAINTAHQNMSPEIWESIFGTEEKMTNAQAIFSLAQYLK